MMPDTKIQDKQAFLSKPHRAIRCRRFWLNPPIRAKSFVAFTIAYLIVVLQVRKAASRDPTSLFFQPELGFERIYSTRREAEARSFVDEWNVTRPYYAPNRNQRVCVGIPTTQRANTSYFETSVGSLLAGLSQEERAELYVMPFIAHVEPQNHSAYQTAWLHGATDDVLIYDLNEQDGKYVAHLEMSEKDHHEKSLIDYKCVLNACYNIGIPFVLIIEDDVLAASGWYAHLKTAIETKVQRSLAEDSLYLRLFFTERHFGWYKENWPTYVFYSLLLEGVIAVGLLSLRRRSRLSRIITPNTFAALLTVYMPACIFLYFAAGRLTISPLAHGIRAMDQNGCCSQALLYPREQIPGLVDRFEEELSGSEPSRAVDALIETYAEEAGLKRWAIIPSPFQHIGTQSGKQSKPEKVQKWGRTSAERVWNFEFETWWMEHAREPMTVEQSGLDADDDHDDGKEEVELVLEASVEIVIE